MPSSVSTSPFKSQELSAAAKHRAKRMDQNKQTETTSNLKENIKESKYQKSALGKQNFLKDRKIQDKVTNEEVFVVSNRRRGRKPSKFIRESHSTEGSEFTRSSALLQRESGRKSVLNDINNNQTRIGTLNMQSRAREQQKLMRESQSKTLSNIKASKQRTSEESKGEKQVKGNSMMSLLLSTGVASAGGLAYYFNTVS